MVVASRARLAVAGSVRYSRSIDLKSGKERGERADRIDPMQRVTQKDCYTSELSQV